MAKKNKVDVELLANLCVARKEYKTKTSAEKLVKGYKDFWGPADSDLDEAFHRHVAMVAGGKVKVLFNKMFPDDGTRLLLREMAKMKKDVHASEFKEIFIHADNGDPEGFVYVLGIRE